MMAEMTEWLKRYIMLVLGIGKAVKDETEDILYDYYGEISMEEQVNREAALSGKELLNEAIELAEKLPDQGFDGNRTMFLDKQLTALETVCRRLSGERFSIREEAKQYFGLDISWVPESEFEAAVEIYNKVLPGSGSVRERLLQHRNKYELPQNKRHLLPEMLQLAVIETRERTDRIIKLPTGEKTDIVPITGKPVKAMAQYLGNYRSAIMVNTGIPFYMPELLSIVSHEGYPGHIAEIILKEEYLIKKKGCYEQQVGFLLTPPYVISEGIALLAMQSIFEPGEAECWMSENIYPKLGMEGDIEDLAAVQKATDLLRGAWCNAALMLDDGCAEHEAADYIMKHTLCNEQNAHHAVRSLKRPFCESYIFTYYYGRKLLEASLCGPDKKEKLRRLLTEQLTLDIL